MYKQALLKQSLLLASTILLALLAAILRRLTVWATVLARRVNIAISVENSNTELGHAEVESALLVRGQNSGGGLDDVVALERVVVVVRVTAGVGEKGQSSLGAALHAVEADGDGLVFAVGGVVAGTLPDESVTALVLAGAPPDWAVAAVRGESLRDGVVGEQRPDVPGGRAGGNCRVGGELDDRDGPLPAVHVAKDGSVEGRRQAIGVALVADEGCGLADTADPPWEVVKATLPACAVVDVGGSDFTNDVSVVVVEAVELVDKLIGLTVWVVVTEHALRVCNDVGSVVELKGDRVDSTRVAGRSRANDLDVRVRLRDGIVEHLEAVLLVRVPSIRVASQPIFVADLDVVESVRLRVTELSTASTPLRVGRTLNELDLVEAVLDPRLKLFRSGEVTVKCKTCVASNDCDTR